MTWFHKGYLNWHPNFRNKRKGLGKPGLFRVDFFPRLGGNLSTKEGNIDRCLSDPVKIVLMLQLCLTCTLTQHSCIPHQPQSLQTLRKTGNGCCIKDKTKFGMRDASRKICEYFIFGVVSRGYLKSVLLCMWVYSFGLVKAGLCPFSF